MGETAMNATIEFWWRDDDARDDTPALQRLLALRREHDLPLALAVVPASATPALFSVVSEEPKVDVLVHGYAHENHAPPGATRSELGPFRPRELIEQELRQGLAKLRTAHPSSLAVLVPPWNNREPELLPSLPGLGYVGVSGWNARRKLRSVPGLTAACTHIDLVSWREGSRLKSPDELAAAVEAEIARQRTEGVFEPIGVLTHHLQMDDAAFGNLAALFRWIEADARFFWSAARNIFARKGTCA
jgi:hypothetical protein